MRILALGTVLAWMWLTAPSVPTDSPPPPLPQPAFSSFPATTLTEVV